MDGRKMWDMLQGVADDTVVLTYTHDDRGTEVYAATNTTDWRAPVVREWVEQGDENGYAGWDTAEGLREWVVIHAEHEAYRDRDARDRAAIDALCATVESFDAAERAFILRAPRYAVEG